MITSHSCCDCDCPLKSLWENLQAACLDSFQSSWCYRHDNIGHLAVNLSLFNWVENEIKDMYLISKSRLSRLDLVRGWSLER